MDCDERLLQPPPFTGYVHVTWHQDTNFENFHLRFSDARTVPAESGYFDDGGDGETWPRRPNHRRALGSALGEDERMVGRLLVQFLEAMKYNTHSALEMVRAHFDLISARAESFMKGWGAKKE